MWARAIEARTWTMSPARVPAACADRADGAAGAARFARDPGEYATGRARLHLVTDTGIDAEQVR